MPSTDKTLPIEAPEVYTTTDAAEFSRLGACMTAAPPEEIYPLPRIEDFSQSAARMQVNGSTMGGSKHPPEILKATTSQAC